MTLVIAHRGASAYQPENTVAAFKEAVRMGADGIELDVHASADGTLVVYHDAHLDGMHIPAVSYQELCRQASHTPPTLSVALKAIGANTIVYIELKTLDAAWDGVLFSAIDSAPAPDNCEVHAFDHRIVHRVLAQREGLRGGVLSASYPLDPVTPVLQAGAQTLWQQGTLIDQELVDRAREAGLNVIAWTVDDRDTMRHLQSLGVHGICSNRPDVAGAVLR